MKNNGGLMGRVEQNEAISKDKTTSQSKPRKSKSGMYILMCLTVTAWGLAYIFVKIALETLEPLSLMFYKYLVALFLVTALKLLFDRDPLVRRKDIPKIVVSALSGLLIYNYAEYSALSYMPISLVTIILAFVPILSILTEWIIFRRASNRKIIIGAFICIFGVALIIGFDWHILLEGRIFGYILAFVCVFSWNVYNFVTESLHGRYSTFTLALNQLICSLLVLLPYVIVTSPPIAEFPPELFVSLLYTGLIGSGFGSLVMVRSLRILGPTTTVLFANFLPVAATIFEWLILRETIAPIQCLGGIIVIGAGYVVIKEKGKSGALGAGGKRNDK